MEILMGIIGWGTFSAVLILAIASMFDGTPKGGLGGNAGEIGGGAEGESSSSKSSFEATPEERELNRLDLELRKAGQEGMMNVQDLALRLSGQLLAGEDLPGYLRGLPGGINPEVTQELVDRSIEDVATSAQLSGILDSGTAGELATRAATDIRTQSEQFNINNLLQLLNLATGRYGAMVQPTMSIGQTLGSRLAGLRSQTIDSSRFGWNASGKATFSGGGEDGALPLPFMQ